MNSTETHPAVELLEDKREQLLGDFNGAGFHEKEIAALRARIDDHEARMMECRLAAHAIEGALEKLR